MADSTLWWLAAGGLIAVELITGTFYLLMISLGLVAAALAAHAGLAHALAMGGCGRGGWRLGVGLAQLQAVTTRHSPSPSQP